MFKYGLIIFNRKLLRDNDKGTKFERIGFDSTRDTASSPVCDESTHFQCADGRGCYSKTERCNRWINCLDNSDEIGCSCVEYLPQGNLIHWVRASKDKQCSKKLVNLGNVLTKLASTVLRFVKQML
jgi:hypothetical protein